MSDLRDKVDFTIAHNFWCSTNVLKDTNQSSEESTQEEDMLFNFIEEEDHICSDEN